MIQIHMRLHNLGVKISDMRWGKHLWQPVSGYGIQEEIVG